MSAMAGLEGAGISGSDHLREALTNCTDPLQAIEEFQVQNGILLPSLRPALPFLDLHGVHRLEFHQSVMEEMRDCLLQQVATIAQDGSKNGTRVLQELLTKSFPLVHNKSLRPVALAIMKHLPKISKDYLKAIRENKELYAESSVEVKQQIWQDQQLLFGDEVSPLLTRYIEEKEKALFSCDGTNPSATAVSTATGISHQSAQATSFFSATPKVRRQSEVVQSLTKMVGKNVKLYDMVLQFLRTLFLRTRKGHYCTLRAELLMALHDLEVHEICSVDPCHKFTWCLDACVREKYIDSKRAKELQGFLDSIRRGQEQVLGDISMILCDPYAIHTVASSIMRTLHQSASTETMPRANEEIILLVRMLSLGLGSWQMIDSQTFKESKVEVAFITRFMPCIVGLLVDDQCQALTSKNIDDVTKVDPVPDFVLGVACENAVASVVMLHYTLQTLRQRDTVAMCRALAAIVHCDRDTVYDDIQLHSIIYLLGQMPEAFVSPVVCEVVFDIFLLPCASQENVLHQLLRLLWTVHHKIPQARLATLMSTIKPENEQHSDTVQLLHENLTKKILSYQPSPPPEPEKLDSPLMSVPVPAPPPVK